MVGKLGAEQKQRRPQHANLQIRAARAGQM